MAARAKQAEYRYFTLKIKRHMEYVKLAPESLALPTRQDIVEIARIYQALGAAPDAIQSLDALQFPLLNLANLYYTNQRLLEERRTMLARIKRRTEQERAAGKKLAKSLEEFKASKGQYEDQVRALNQEISGVLSQKQKEYEYKEYVAKASLNMHDPSL